MKIEVKRKKEEKKYPWMGIDDDGDVCIFVEENQGFWIFMDGKIPTGEMEIISGDLYNESDFKPFNGTITLSNY